MDKSFCEVLERAGIPISQSELKEFDIQLIKIANVTRIPPEALMEAFFQLYKTADEACKTFEALMEGFDYEPLPEKELKPRPTRKLFRGNPNKFFNERIRIKKFTQNKRISSKPRRGRDHPAGCVGSNYQLSLVIASSASMHLLFLIVGSLSQRYARTRIL